MDKYVTIKSNLLEIAEREKNVKAVIAIGSSVRKTVKADEYSDLDLIIVTEDTDRWLYGSLLEEIGDMKISFVESTFGGAKERRVLYENALDVDVTVITPSQFETAVREGVASWVCNRGYRVLYDMIGIRDLMAQYVSDEIGHTDLTEDEFVNMTNDFFFHIIWASKKILRGEMWAAKMCIDAYLKNDLLKIIEMYSADQYHVDTWHDGRFLDQWADAETKEALKGCFAHYDREDMVASMIETRNLFSRLAQAVAAIRNYHYPKSEEEYASRILLEYFER